jgi:dienelactone hydrolase
LPCYRNQSTFLTTHLASWGFVVASVDYLERGLASVLGQQPDPQLEDTELTRMVVSLMAAENERAGGLLEGRVSTDRIAITGHSAGGGTAIRFGGEPDVVTYIPLSAATSSDNPAASRTSLPFGSPVTSTASSTPSARSLPSRRRARSTRRLAWC